MSSMTNVLNNAIDILNLIDKYKRLKRVMSDKETEIIIDEIIKDLKELL